MRLLLILATLIALLLALSDCAPSVNWTVTRRANSSESVQLTIAIKQRRVDELQRKLIAVSDPDSNEYGQFLSLHEVNELVAPSKASVSAVMRWLKRHGVGMATASHSGNFDFVSVVTDIGTAEAMLSAEYHEYKHELTGARVLRCREYTLPADVREHVDVVGPVNRFPLSKQIMTRPRQTTARRSPDAPCSDGTDPACLRSLYQVGNFTGVTSNSTSAVTGFLEQYISDVDLQTFFKQFDPASSGRHANIVGPNDPSSPGIEASLDIQYSMALGHGIGTNTFWYTAGRAPNNTENEPFLKFLDDLASTKEVPVVISTSYGDDEPTVDDAYAQRVNTEFMKTGVRGISLIFASGDSGVGAANQRCTRFVPTFPAISPWVTSVGATVDYAPEKGVSFSSGGFADYFAAPEYQQSAINGYLTKYAHDLPNASYYNASGRGFPDVSANGVDFPIVVGGGTFGVDGTSCSSPTFAAIISLVVDARYAAGKSSLGFLNPLFYKHPEIFNDITAGNNPNCGTNGFYAAVGWDPITGLGTPNFPQILALAKQMK